MELEIHLIKRNQDGDRFHHIKMKSRRTLEQNIARVRKVLEAFPAFPIQEESMNSCFKMLVWNCRGAGNNNFQANFTALVNIHNPVVVALLETKVCLSSMGMFFTSKGFTAASLVDPNGRAGGIWLL